MKFINRRKIRISIALILINILVSIPVQRVEAVTDFTKTDRIFPTKFDTIESNFEPDAGMLLIDITNGRALEGAGITKDYYSPDVKKLAFLIAILDINEIQDNIFINSDNEALINVIPELSKGDMISVSELLKHYMYTESSDIQAVLMSYFSLDYNSLAAAVNKIVKASWLIDTTITGEGIKSSSQLTNVYDLYVFTDKLLEYQWTLENIGKKEIEINWSDLSGEEKSIFITDKKYSDAVNTIPAGFTFTGHFTSKDSTGGSQIIISTDETNTAYISVILGKSIKDNLNYISKKVMLTQTETAYLTIKEEEMLKQPAAPSPQPVPTAVPVITPTKAPVITEKPPKATPDAEDTEEIEPEVIVTITPVPVSGSYSTPTSSSSSAYIPKINYNLQKYGQVILPNSNENEKYQYLLGTKEKFYTFDMPPSGYKMEAEAAANMITITVPVWKMAESGQKFSSQYDITVNKKLAANVKAIFDEIYRLSIKFPIKVLKGYAYREVGGVGLNNVTLMSMHSYGAAIDINPDDFDNDYYLGAGNDLRDKSNPYCIPDEVIEIFEDYGWNWGGNFNICADTMHFQYLGLNYLTYQGNDPFRVLKAAEGLYKGMDVWNLQIRLKELGYRISVDGIYGRETESVVTKFQKKQGIEPTGIVDYKTWETVINLTHYMQYIF